MILRNQWSSLLYDQLVGKFSWWTLDLDDPPSDCPLLCGYLSPIGLCACWCLIKIQRRMSSYSLYFLVLGLGFGGTYVTLFSLPSLFASMNFILAYLIGHREDEGFILYGAIAAVAFLIDPMTSCPVYLLAFLGLAAFNIKQKRWARGFINCWQLSLVSLVFYPIGYITVLNQTFWLCH